MSSSRAFGVSQNVNRRRAGANSGAADMSYIQSHYDVSNDFYALFLDKTLTYSCAKFDSPTSTLEEAQLAKIDLSLSKCDLKPGHTLLDIGCGWGATAARAREKYNVNVIGLTLSQAQYDKDRELAKSLNAHGKPTLEFRLEPWETFTPSPTQPIDRIVSIGAFEHFGRAKYPEFFTRCRALLDHAKDGPNGGGVMLLHTITAGKPSMDYDFLRFAHFIATQIFPGGDVPSPESVITAARAANFELVHVESLRPHYARTLDCWATNLAANEKPARALVGDAVYDKYMKYLTGCANLFRTGECNLHQFRFHCV